METRIAKIISLIFHPIIIPTYILLILFNLKAYFSLIIPYHTKLIIIIMVFIMTFILPLLFTIILKKKDIVKTFQMETREERVYPFMITAICYYLTYYIIKQMQLPPVFYLINIGGVFLVIAILIINFYWKISVHLTGIGGMLGTLIGLSLRFMVDMPFIIFIVILISGLLGFARLKLHAHSPAQVYAGFLMGFSVMLLLFYI